METTKGTLIAIGGHEDRKGEMTILRRVAELVGGKRLVVTTAGSSEPDELWSEYEYAFPKLGVRDVVHLPIDTREQALSKQARAMLEDAGGVFFTGGDQLKITTQLGGTELCDAMHRLYDSGGLIAGTSAGASVMSETMIVSGDAEKSHRISDFLRLSPGLGFISGMVIDQHFAERGRIARLLGIVGQNPRALGVGIDEDTAIEISGHAEFRVLGQGAVYVLDGRPITSTNFTESSEGKTMSLFHACLHVMSDSDCFDLQTRTPSRGPRDG